MQNPMESPNFWLAMVVLVTAFAIMTYEGPDESRWGITGAAVGTSVPADEEAVDVMTFSEEDVQTIVIETQDIVGKTED